MCSHVPTYSQRQINYCYTCGFIYAGRGIAVPRNSLARYDRQHLRIRRSVQFILAGAVRYNVPRICATLLCRALRRVNRMCSSTLSVNCEKAEKDMHYKHKIYNKQNHYTHKKTTDYIL